jgi:hypothetical protein
MSSSSATSAGGSRRSHACLRNPLNTWACNASPSATWSKADVLWLQVRTTAAVAEGDELCFSYGERASDDLFVHYGFVPLRNPRDEARALPPPVRLRTAVCVPFQAVPADAGLAGRACD